MESGGANNILFPVRVPKAAVFLRCESSHVFSLTGLRGESPQEHELCYIFGPCPKCKPSSVHPHASGPHLCAFCNRPMRLNIDRTYSCLTPSCWLSHTVAETGTDVAVKIWTDVWRGKSNTFFYGTDTRTSRVSEAFKSITDGDLEAAETLLDMSKDQPGQGK